MYTLSVFLIVAILQSVQLGYGAPLTPEQEQIHSLVAEHVLNQANRPISFRMESPSVPFIGRVSEISELKWAHLDNKMVVITGAKGVGKSELAKKYAQEIKVDNTSSTIWINSESHSSIIDAFKDLSTTLGLNIENKDHISVIKAVFDHFNNRKSLFVFDNADVENVIVQNLPIWIKKSKFIKVIITSRNDLWDEKVFKLIKLVPFTLDESKEYIKASINREINMAIDDESCLKLSELLKYIPLGLSGAVKEIIKQNYLNPSKVYTINDFIESFNAKPVLNVTEVRGPTPDELEDAVSSKIQEEVKRVGDQVTDEAKRFASSVKNEGKRVEQKIKKWFG